MTAPVALFTRRAGALVASEPILGDCEACDCRCDAFPCTNADPKGPLEIAAAAAKE